MTRKEAVAWQEKLFPRRYWLLAGGEGVSLEVRVPLVTWAHSSTLCDICFALRASCTGVSVSPWGTDFLREVCDMLEARLATWEPVETWWSGLDVGVKAMVEAAVTLGRLAMEPLTLAVKR